MSVAWGYPDGQGAATCVLATEGCEMPRQSRMQRSTGKAAAFVAVLLAAAGPVFAQKAAPPAATPRPLAPAVTAEPAPPAAAPRPAVTAEPENTTASFGDWTLRCQRVGEGAQSKRTCEVVQILRTHGPQGQQVTFAQIALGYPLAGQPMRLVVMLPVSVSFPSVANIATDEKDSGTDLAWSRCVPTSCFAESQVKDDMLLRWRAFGEPGRLTFKDAAGREIRTAVSYRGVAQALDALAKANAAVN
jgi:invasion protein IalB